MAPSSSLISVIKGVLSLGNGEGKGQIRKTGKMEMTKAETIINKAISTRINEIFAESVEFLSCIGQYLPDTLLHKRDEVQVNIKMVKDHYNSERELR